MTIMTTRGEMFAGLTVALVTPMRDDEVDYDGLRELVDWHVDQGTDCLAPVGTTGESPTLSHEEHDRVIDTVIEQVGGRIRVMAGTGSNSTAEALRLTRHAAKAGADGALVVAPYYNKPTQEGLYLHYRALAEAVDIPIIVYNIPGRTGRNIEVSTFVRLSEFDNIVAVKEATGSLDQASDIIAQTDLTILSGDDSLTLPLLSIGGRGVVSVVGNIIPADMKALLHAYDHGRVEEAANWHKKLFPLCRDMLGLATNPIPIKTAMKLLGRGTGEMRLPMCPMDEAGEAKLRRSLAAYGLLVEAHVRG
jgi:4-hydroxy-tetrahydrodipicolinate synthase